MKEFLFDEFESVSAKQWKQTIQYDLKGADYNESLIWKSPESIHVKPFYHRRDFESHIKPIPGHPKTWKIAQTVFVDDEHIANKIAKNALSQGATSIIFKVEKDFDTTLLLKEIPFDKTYLIFDFQYYSEVFISQLTEALKNNNANYLFLIDSIGQLVRTGNWFSSQKEDFKNLANIVETQTDAIAIKLGTLQNAGARIVQQLAYGMAHANEYLNLLASKNPNLTLTFQVSMGANYFFEIAKIRALRKLYAVLAAEYKLPTTCKILATPTLRNKTIYDYNVNMLRTTTESMSAILGGADVVSNLAYDTVFRKSNEFGERISRNQLLILREESYFDLVSNPVDGTYYIERLTDELAEKALNIFKEIEKGGGYIAQLHEGIIQKKIKESASKEQEQFNAGELKLVGTNYQINTQDRIKDALELFPFVKRNPVKTLIEPVIPKRLSEEKEQERLNEEK